MTMFVKLFSHKKELRNKTKTNAGTPFATTWVQLEILILSAISQKEKDKYHMIPLILWNLNYGINEPFHRTDSHMDN